MYPHPLSKMRTELLWDGIDGLFTRDEAKAVAEATAQAGGREVSLCVKVFDVFGCAASITLEVRV